MSSSQEPGVSVRVRAAVSAMLVFVSGQSVACHAFVASEGGEQPPCAAPAGSKPYLLGLSRSDRRALLTMAQRGVAVVRAEDAACGLRLEMVDGCWAPGRYVYRAEASRTTVHIRRAIDVPATLPLAPQNYQRLAADIGGLELQVLQAGRLVAPPYARLGRRVLEGRRLACSNATHVVVGLAVGAYGAVAAPTELFGKMADIVFSVPKGRGLKDIERQGQWGACEQASATRRRTDGCTVPLRADLVPLRPPSPPTGRVEFDAGRFIRGTNIGEARPEHEVQLSAFNIDSIEVSAGQYERCVEAGRCTKAGRGRMCNGGRPSRTTHPINCVSWYQARDYCRSIGRRLPTEAEWERAARSSAPGPYPWGADWPPPDGSVNLVDEVATESHPEWAVAPNFVDGFAETAPVGLLAPDQKMRDLGGNVMEWTNDYFAPYQAGLQVDPRGPSEGELKVVRGGSFGHGEASEFFRTKRRAYRPDRASAHIGFRCAGP